ncbi:MAG: serine/threonine-protein phosphatase [Lachnospiraceae bacterium]|nr:serine/threonine-protein phosphatase [Lachnospiraceae bacterium]
MYQPTGVGDSFRIASYGLPPSKIIEVVNNRLSRYNEDDLTLSAWFGIYEISTGRVTAVNAGHECPLMVSGDGLKEIDEDICGFIIGMTEGISYQEYSFSLEPGSHLFLYTDGILNAVNSAGESFGYDRMIKAISEANSSTDSTDRDGLYESMRHEIGAVQDAVFEFAGNETLCVDITMLVLGRND